jgi:hypothetical protein
LEIALEWVLFRLLKISPDPKEVLADFNSHMDEQQRTLKEAGIKVLLEGRAEVFSQLSRAESMVAEVQESLCKSVRFG